MWELIVDLFIPQMKQAQKSQDCKNKHYSHVTNFSSSGSEGCWYIPGAMVYFFCISGSRHTAAMFHLAFAPHWLVLLLIPRSCALSLTGL